MISASVAIAIGTLIRKIAAPGDRRDEPAADERPDQERDPGPGRPGADRGAALLAAEDDGDRRERGRCQQRPGDALQRRARRSATSPFQASAQRTEVTAKATTPITKTRLPPKRSPSEPPTRISEPSVSR